MIRTSAMNARTTSSETGGRLRFASIACVVLVLSLASEAGAQQTVVSIQQDHFLLNDAITHPGTAAEGLLLNSRMVQAIFDDENPLTVGQSAYPDTRIWDPERNVQEFMDALPIYAAHGLRAVTVGLQGGSPGWSAGDDQPGIVSAFYSDGSIKRAWLDRLNRVIRAADQKGIVVIVSLFYFGQDHRLADEAAVITAVDGVTDWLLDQAYTNVLVEVDNETGEPYDHAILQPARVGELIQRIKARSNGRLKVSTSLSAGALPSAALVAGSDYVALHGNGQPASTIASMVDQLRGMSAFRASPKPIVFNEDSTSLANFDAAVGSEASWGYYDQGDNNYVDGYQSPPVNWTINTTSKRNFFDLVAAFTQSAGAIDAASLDLRVTHFTLIDADTDQPIQTLDLGTGRSITLNLAQLPTRNLNLRADTSPAIVGSVRFTVNGGAERIEQSAPYALAGDINGDYMTWTLGAGTHVIAATPYSGSNASGTAGSLSTLVLTIIE